MIDVNDKKQVEQFRKQAIRKYDLSEKTISDYLGSLVGHIKYVQEAGRKIGVNENQLLIHDQSKFSDEEFPAYAAHFYGNDDPDVYAVAWLHHMNHNQHHWNHWIFPDGFTPKDTSVENGIVFMPDSFSLEMVADWMGASRQYTGSWDMTEWLAENSESILLHSKTARHVGSVLETLGYADVKFGKMLKSKSSYNSNPTYTFAAASSDPTRTLNLRRQYMAEFKRRWNKAKKAIKQTIIDNDALGLIPVDLRFRNQEDTRPADEFTGSDAAKIAAFAIWLRSLMDTAVLGAKRTGDAVEFDGWQDNYIRQGYFRGIRHANDDARNAGMDVTMPPFDEQGTSILMDKVHLAALAVLFAKYNNDLNGITDEFVKQTMRIVTEALQQDTRPADLYALIEDRLNAIGMTRSDTLVQVSIVEAVNDAILNRLGQLGILFVGIDAELAYWETVGDNRVCPLCIAGSQQDNGFGPGIYLISDARGLLPRHPRCRCRFVGAIFRR